MKFILRFIIITLVIFLSCKQEDKNIQLKEGNYVAQLEAQDNKAIPFVFKVMSSNSIEIYNADEVIQVDEITYQNDSVFIQLPVFESVLKAKINEDNSLVGVYLKPNLNRSVPFTAKIDRERFKTTQEPEYSVTGKWETTFSPNNPDDSYIAKGVFTQNGSKVTGTFRTTTGDYRFLEGVMNGNELKLSTFDGAHAFLFTASVNDSLMKGIFYSGNTWKEPFVAKRNVAFELPDANSLTYLNDGYDKIAFLFPDETGKLVSLTDDRFKDKVVIVQIMGTWCPNCLDETKFYADYYKENKNKPLEIVALAFEYAKSDSVAFKAINRLKDRVDVQYPILLAQTGTSSKSKAQEKLPMLNHVLSYPTSIFIDKKGQVRKIHTGFNGPATGKKYKEFVEEFESFVSMLVDE